LKEHFSYIGKLLEDKEEVLITKGTRGGFGNSNAFFKNKKSSYAPKPKLKYLGKQ
jgi:GTPase involved in cell partitioning and DNA repair